ncbi:TRAP transporter small permease [Avibacterium paragallinarum]|uniref:TRAP transporter small permease protein n=1 Tax=Avibacterium paragallinarum TaxID=728 RepID=A0A0F5EZX6_AVIPA|nr:TRAP transporter small permease [Avibacterium paragallinarum]KAA6209912.1 TRAP transporter small permease [Avibacterium paragallinarum]KKB02179.1 C4-dicarboxylate ABC transporter permease [Avibacterium paragallinarum]RZN60093.1 TRAP transporter small permease [Avibacterium paragallinarum]RZN73576.1 TRAP transporter small permease [Avibacterium paragallinarum]SUU97256.1 2,3-diketo-L-gulonate TRAP transporter small permease protein yiaM [Avibacterium paragallinarum]
MEKFIHFMNKTLSIMCVILCSVLVCCVVWQVFSRYILNTPSTYTDELARFLFIWVGLIGAAYALGQKKHLAIDLLATKFEHSPKQFHQLTLAINGISLFFVLTIMCYGGVNLVRDTMANGQISPVLGIEMGLVYLAIPISGLFILLYLLRDLFNNFQQIKMNA